MTGSALNVRAANLTDAAVIADVVQAAFASTKMGYQGEAGLVQALASDGDVLCSLIAEVDAEIIGFALFSRMRVIADGAEWRGAALAPVAVRPDWQQRGVGARLILAGVDALQDAGVQISFVLGHPDYYPRFGYRAEVAAPFASPYAGPHFMALLLDETLQIPTSARADYAAAFSR